MHPTSAKDHRPAFLLAFLGYLLFVVYGSLVPFELRPMTWDTAVEGLLNIQFLDLGVVSRADWIANIVLYIPLAFLGCAALFGLGRAGWSASLGVVLVLILGLGVAVGVEFAQQWFAPRTVSLNDLIAEGIGTVIGLALWIFGRRGLAALGSDIARGGRASLLAALIGYGLLYLVLALFPFDFLVSTEEWRWKLESGNYGWLVAPTCGGTMRCLARLALDALALLPAGVLAALLWPRLSLAGLVMVGLGIGLVLETIQLSLASGMSQGASVLMRGLGLGLGAVIGGWLRVSGPRPLADAVALGAPILLLPYLAAMALVSDWFSVPALDPGSAAARLAEVRWLPLYYHYFTTEAVAMASSLAQLVLYAPFGLWAWALTARRGGPGGAGRGAGGGAGGATIAIGSALSAAVLIEAGKLFFPPKHPDPTNLLLAMAGSLAVYGLAWWFQRVLEGARGGSSSRRGWDAPEPVGRAPEPSATAPAPRSGAGIAVASVADPEPPGVALPRATLVGLALATPFALAALWGVVSHPVAWPILAVHAVLLGLLLWWRPAAWLLVLPVLLPVLDFAPWTGRLALDAFDVAVLVTLALGYARLWGLAPVPWPNLVYPLALGLAWLSWVVSATLGLWPLLGGAFPPADASHGPLAAWNGAKGMLWALLLVPLLRRLPPFSPPGEVTRLLRAGFGVGLGAFALVVLWERHVFVGLADFSDPFRVTGTFSGLATGGAYIEAYLVATLALVLPLLMVKGNLAARALALGLGLLGLYALYVTYARAGYLGLGVALVVLAIGVLWLRLGRRWWRPAASLALLTVVGLGAWGLVSGGFAGERLRQAMPDLAERAAHWTRGVGLMNGSALVGAGFGQYPAEALISGAFEPPPGGFVILREGETNWLRLYGGQNVYLEQPVALGPNQEALLRVTLRDGAAGEGPRVALCEKALLYSFDCLWLPDGARGPGGGTLDGPLEVETGTLGSGGNWPHRPVKLSLHNASRTPVDIARVSLRAGGRELLANGDFAQGARHWLLSSDQREAWHLDQLWLETWFAQGWLGVLALGLLLVAALAELIPRLRLGEPFAVALTASLAGLFTVGLLGSVLDDPRTTLLTYLLLLLPLGLYVGERRTRQPGRRRRRRRSRRSSSGREDGAKARAAEGADGALPGPGALVSSPRL